MNRTVKDATVKSFHCNNHNQLRYSQTRSTGLRSRPSGGRGAKVVLPGTTSAPVLPDTAIILASLRHWIEHYCKFRPHSA